MLDTKYRGIDERQIKCACGDENCSQTGISFENTFDENHLRFHFLEDSGAGFLYQRTKSMVLTKQTAKELIKALKQLKFK
jgi:hypothetical protein